MTILNLHQTALRPEPKRDRFGRYMITPAGGGKPKAMSRVTTHAKRLDDAFGLVAWKQRQVAIGLARRPDLVALAASTTDKKRLDDLCEAAMAAAGSNVGANIGTALHGFTEIHDLGLPTPIPEAQRADVEAYAAGLARLEIEVLPEYVERIVVLDGLGLAGTLDRIVRVGDTLMIADLKTGQSLDYAWGSIAVQLACYANADTMYDPATEKHSPMPGGISLTEALVFHLPAGSGHCVVHTVDIAAGWDAAQLAVDVQAWRKRKGLSAPMTQPRLTAAKVQEVFGACEVIDLRGQLAEWAKERLGWIKAHAKTEIFAEVAALWPDGVPGFKGDHAHTEEELDKILALLDGVEARHRLEFPERSDPRKTHTRSVQVSTVDPVDRPATAEEVAGVRAALGAAPEWVQRTVGIWLTEANTYNVGWGLKTEPTRRKVTIASAVISLLGLGSAGDITAFRSALDAILGREPVGDIGEELGLLELDEAVALSKAALHLRASGTCSPEAIASAIGWTPPHLRQATTPTKPRKTKEQAA